jgi:hypothetical protein
MNTESRISNSEGSVGRPHSIGWEIPLRFPNQVEDRLLPLSPQEEVGLLQRWIAREGELGFFSPSLNPSCLREQVGSERTVSKIRSTKNETPACLFGTRRAGRLNKSEIRISKFEISFCRLHLSDLGFRISNFLPISNLGFRICEQSS